MDLIRMHGRFISLFVGGIKIFPFNSMRSKHQFQLVLNPQLMRMLDNSEKSGITGGFPSHTGFPIVSQVEWPLFHTLGHAETQAHKNYKVGP